MHSGKQAKRRTALASERWTGLEYMHAEKNLSPMTHHRD
jgi:hypothetical protein